MLKLALPVSWVGEVLSVAETINENGPAVVGIPVIAPVDELKVKPSGSPALTE
jgi:hypothetical protein